MKSLRQEEKDIFHSSKNSPERAETPPRIERIFEKYDLGKKLFHCPSKGESGGPFWTGDEVACESLAVRGRRLGVRVSLTLKTNCRNDGKKEKGTRTLLPEK